MTQPGRPKGIRVTACECGRRVAGLLGKRKACPDCKKIVTIKLLKTPKAKNPKNKFL